MNKLNVTPGEWIVKEMLTKTYDTYQKVTIDEGESICNITTRNMERQKNNAILIADAGTTYNKCHKLPSELMQENEELRRAIELTIAVIENEYPGGAKSLQELLTKHSQQS